MEPQLPPFAIDGSSDDGFSLDETPETKEAVIRVTTSGFFPNTNVEISTTAVHAMPFRVDDSFIVFAMAKYLGDLRQNIRRFRCSVYSDRPNRKRTTDRVHLRHLIKERNATAALLARAAWDMVGILQDAYNHEWYAECDATGEEWVDTPYLRYLVARIADLEQLM
jgi:hypothetical protein